MSSFVHFTTVPALSCAAEKAGLWPQDAGPVLAFAAGALLLLAGAKAVVALRDASQAFVVGKLSLLADADAIVVVASHGLPDPA
ncbi:hypothetical protein [Streptomyces rimosus]|uniref:hypothetical protein n=1 Tax=Streptomyces rimosus TaxID=1927 RepID=UPI0004C9A698|nr:hypothetical protein [Streptomyces rimosus]